MWLIWTRRTRYVYLRIGKYLWRNTIIFFVDIILLPRTKSRVFSGILVLGTLVFFLYFSFTFSWLCGSLSPCGSITPTFPQSPFYYLLIKFSNTYVIMNWFNLYFHSYIYPDPSRHMTLKRRCYNVVLTYVRQLKHLIEVSCWSLLRLCWKNQWKTSMIFSLLFGLVWDVLCQKSVYNKVYYHSWNVFRHVSMTIYSKNNLFKQYCIIAWWWHYMCRKASLNKNFLLWFI